MAAVNTVPKEVIEMCKGKVVLNLGCADDFFGDIRVDMEKSPATTLVANVEDGLPLKSGSVDIVYMQFMFEHLTNINKVLKECYRLLKKGGKIIVITDNAGFIGFHSGKWTRVLSTIHYGGYRAADGDMHFGLYTTEHIRNHLERGGFKIEKIKYQKYWDIRPRTFLKRNIARFVDKVFKLVGLEQMSAYSILAVGVKK
jgi:ubiquinone/menaquinone biosynthesis C-methylase UbiE